jgi:hypothetical protein
MRVAEIIRSLIDLLDQVEQGQTGSSPGNRLSPVAVEKPEDCEGEKMIPPLQAKLELLKKASGVDNIYDDDEEGSDELDAIKKLTGIDAVMQHEAGEDNDITG